MGINSIPLVDFLSENNFIVYNYFSKNELAFKIIDFKIFGENDIRIAYFLNLHTIVADMSNFSKIKHLMELKMYLNDINTYIYISGVNDDEFYIPKPISLFDPMKGLTVYRLIGKEGNSGAYIFKEL